LLTLSDEQTNALTLSQIYIPPQPLIGAMADEQPISDNEVWERLARARDVLAKRRLYRYWRYGIASRAEGIGAFGSGVPGAGES
jgi:hypothetical protein